MRLFRELASEIRYRTRNLSLSKKELNAIGGIIAMSVLPFAVYMCIGIFICSLFYGLGGEDYCKWKPERRVTYVFYYMDYAPRKTACWLWEPIKEKKKKVALTLNDKELRELDKQLFGEFQ